MEWLTNVWSKPKILWSAVDHVWMAAQILVLFIALMLLVLLVLWAYERYR